MVNRGKPLITFQVIIIDYYIRSTAERQSWNFLHGQKSLVNKSHKSVCIAPTKIQEDVKFLNTYKQKEKKTI